jgi:hypothetical protein
MEEAMNEGDKRGAAMQAAWKRVKGSKSRLWSEWMVIGDGLLEGRRWAMAQAETNQPSGKAFVLAYSEWLRRWDVHDMDASDRAKLLQIMEERPAVEEWRATLTHRERDNLNNPTVVWRKWTAATRIRRPRSRTQQVTAQVYQRAKARIEELEQELTHANQELTHAKARIEELEGGKATTEEEQPTSSPHVHIEQLELELATTEESPRVYRGIEEAKWRSPLHDDKRFWVENWQQRKKQSQ